MGNADPVVKCPGPGQRGDLLQAFELVRGHELATFVAAGNEGEVVVQPGQLFSQFSSGLRLGPAVGNRFQAGDLGVAFEDLEAHAYFVDAVVECFELGRLVDHVFRRRHLAAIVQPGRDMDRFPLLVAELEVLERPAGLGACGACQHLGQFRHPGAVAAGVGALGVDRAGDQLNEGFEQHLLGLDQFLAFK